MIQNKLLCRVRQAFLPGLLVFLVVSPYFEGDSRMFDRPNQIQESSLPDNFQKVAGKWGAAFKVLKLENPVVKWASVLSVGALLIVLTGLAYLISLIGFKAQRRYYWYYLGLCLAAIAVSIVLLYAGVWTKIPLWLSDLAGLALVYLCWRAGHSPVHV